MPGAFILPYFSTPDLFPDFLAPIAKAAVAAHSTLQPEAASLVKAEPGMPTGAKPTAATITVGGTAAAGTGVINVLGRQVSFAIDGASNTTTAAAIVTAINAIAALAAVVTASNVAAVVTLTAVNSDNLLNGLVSTTVSNSSATVTLTHVAFGVNGAGPVTPQDNFVVQAGRVTYAVRAGHPLLATGALLSGVQAALTTGAAIV